MGASKWGLLNGDFLMGTSKWGLLNGDFLMGASEWGLLNSTEIDRSCFIREIFYVEF